MKNVLYVSYDGMTDPLGQSQVLPYIIGLSKLGYKFWLLSCEKPDRFQQNKQIVDELAKANGIEWHPLPYTKQPPVLSTLIDVRRMKKEAVRLHKSIGFDIVHCRSYVGSLTGLHLKKKFGVKYLFDMRGFWANEKVDAGQWKLDNPLYKSVYRYFKNRESEFVQQADYIISLTHKGVAKMMEWKHVRVNPDRIQVIPCCVDVDLFQREKVIEQQRAQLRKELQVQENDLLLSYLGSIGTWYMLEEMLDFFKVFKDRFPHARLLFITHDEHDRILKTAKTKGLSADDVIMRGAKRAEVPALLSLCSYSLFFIRPTYSKSASSPTKQGELMAMGTPVICNAGVGDTDAIIKRYHSGVLVNKMETADYQQAIDELSVKNFDSTEIRNGALDYFALANGVTKYADVYQKILS